MEGQSIVVSYKYTITVFPRVWYQCWPGPFSTSGTNVRTLYPYSMSIDMLGRMLIFVDLSLSEMYVTTLGCRE